MQTGNVPALGAAACWYYEKRDDNGNLVLDDNGNPIPTGHAAIVEQISYDANNNWTSLVTSNSAWYRVDDEDPYSSEGTPSEGYPYWYTRTYNPTSILSVPDHTEGYFQGFVYHPLFPPNTPVMNTETFLALIARKKKERLKQIYIERRRGK